MTTYYQQTVRTTQAFGVPGQLIYEGPRRVFPWTLVSSPNPNVVGSTWYTEVSEGVAAAGGSGTPAGFLCDPHAYALYGTSGFNQALTPTLTVPDETIGELATMGFFVALLTTAANIGDLLVYNISTGAMASISSAVTFTASQSALNLTVTGTPSSPLLPGQSLGSSFLPGTVIESQTSGTPGGAGVYVTNLSQTVASGTYTGGAAQPPSGYALVPAGKVVLRQTAANGLAIIQL